MTVTCDALCHGAPVCKETRPLSPPTFLHNQSPMADEPVLSDELLRDRARIFEEFLKDCPDNDYDADIGTMLDQDKTRLLVSVDDLRRYNKDYADG